MASAVYRSKAAFSIRGGFNGGTLASLFNMLAAGQSRAMSDPFLLNPEGSRPDQEWRHRDPVGPHFDPDFSAWLGPFMMSTINTRVVRRSAALLGYADGFAYQEYLRLGRGAVAAMAATGLSVGSYASQLALRLGPVRGMVQRLAPKPGEGALQRQHGRWVVPVPVCGHRGQRDGGSGADSRPGGPRKSGYNQNAL
jgi:short subunit dehydrogenase-like uncharacterized protein